MAVAVVAAALTEATDVVGAECGYSRRQPGQQSRELIEALSDAGGAHVAWLFEVRQIGDWPREL